MQLLDDWTTAVCDALNLGPVTEHVDSGLVLQLARDVAHTVSRPAAPDPTSAADDITRLAQRWPPDAS